MPILNPKRILIVDDNESIHNDFNKILESHTMDLSFNEAKSLLFGGDFNNTKQEAPSSYIIDSAYQGEEAVECVKIAKAEDHPYALAFVDVRMPPGWDGIKTVQNIWGIDPNIQVIICTAYSDYSWREMFDQLHFGDNLLILKKPFDSIEVYQLASALTKKWELKHLVREQLENLDLMVQERTAQLHLANRIKSDFLSNMSLELRTPINSIVGFSELLYDENINNSSHHKEYCNNILICAKHLMQMINDMFDISEIESEKMQFFPVPVNVRKLVNDVKNIYLTHIDAKHIQFDIKIDPKLSDIVIDPKKLKQIIFHYISNALKFTHDGDKVTVSLSALNRDQLRIEVTDTGIGIKEEDLDKLFMAFKQLDSSASKMYPGTGIGLILVRRIVELQGGKVGVTSTFGKGSTFFAVLPYKAVKGDKND